MNGDDEDNKSGAPPIKVDVSAKATLEAKTEIPSEASGRFVSAAAGTIEHLNKMISPFAERQALKTDHIRLQRVDVATEILRRSQKNLIDRKREVKPVPIKALIRILEDGSLEEPDDDDLIDMWANLLASASIEYGNDVINCAKILSEIGTQEARFLNMMAGDGNLGYEALNAAGRAHDVLIAFLKHSPIDFMTFDKHDRFDDLGQHLLDHHMSLVSVNIFNAQTLVEEHEAPLIGSSYYFGGVSNDVLEKLFLVHREEVKISRVKYGVQRFTQLGLVFVRRMRGESPVL